MHGSGVGGGKMTPCHVCPLSNFGGEVQGPVLVLKREFFSFFGREKSPSLFLQEQHTTKLKIEISRRVSLALGAQSATVLTLHAICFTMVPVGVGVGVRGKCIFRALK